MVHLTVSSSSKGMSLNSKVYNPMSLPGGNSLAYGKGRAIIFHAMYTIKADIVYPVIYK